MSSKVKDQSMLLGKFWQVLALFAFLWLGLLLPSYAQRFVGKVILGISANQIEGDRLVGFNKPGFFGGFGAAFPLNEQWSIEPELLFSMKGSRSSEQEQNLVGRIEIISLNYIELPILLNYNLREDLNLHGGVSLNYLLSASVDNGTNLGPQDKRSQFKAYDLCVTVGAHYFPFDSFGLGMRWSYSMLPFYAIEDASNLSAINNLLYGYTGMFNNSLQFSVMYLLYR